MPVTLGESTAIPKIHVQQQHIWTPSSKELFPHTHLRKWYPGGAQKKSKPELNISKQRIRVSSCSPSSTPTRQPWAVTAARWRSYCHEQSFTRKADDGRKVKARKSLQEVGLGKRLVAEVLRMSGWHLIFQTHLRGSKPLLEQVELLNCCWQIIK